MIPLSAHGKAHRLSEPIIGKIASIRGGLVTSHSASRGVGWRRARDGFDAVLCQQLISPSVLSALNLHPSFMVSRRLHLAEGDVVEAR